MDPLAPIPGEDPAFLDVLEHVSRLAPVEKPCLVVGERGTGKELFTSRLHYLSRRWDQPLVKVNCAALTESLLESELFGHEAGAFTGATRRHIGCFERADGGTLVLDEIASASLAVQGNRAAIEAMKHCEVVVDCTVEGLIHAPEWPEVEAAGARLLVITNEHPEILERTEPRAELGPKVEIGVQMLREAREMRVTSAAGTDLTVESTPIKSVETLTCA